MKMDKQKITIIALSVVVFLFSQYIILDKFLEQNQDNLFRSFQNGYQQGLTDGVSSIFDQTENCEVASITIKNSTKEIFDFACLEGVPDESP